MLFEENMRIIDKSDLNLLTQRSYHGRSFQQLSPNLLTNHGNKGYLFEVDPTKSFQSEQLELNNIKTTAETIHEIQSIQRELIKKVMKILVYLKVSEINNAIAKSTQFWSPVNFDPVSHGKFFESQ